MAAMALLLVVIEGLLSRQFVWCTAPTPRRSAAATAVIAAIAAAVGSPDAALAKKKKKKKEEEEKKFELAYLPAPNTSGTVFPDYDNPPTPDENPVIRELQRKSWERQPEIRIKEWLQVNMKTNTTIFLAFTPKYPVRYVSDSSRFDLMEKPSLKEAITLGKILQDPAFDFKNEEFKSWVYAAAKDEEWSATNLNITATLQMPDTLLKRIARLRSLKFGG